MLKEDIEKWVLDGGLLLHEAMKQSSTLSEEEVINLVGLLFKGVNIDAQNKHNATPLHVAVKSKNLQLVRYLVAYGADIEAQNLYKATPLHNASREGFPEIVSYLICQGSEINAQTVEGDTPLHQAVRKNKPDNVKTLILAGADTHIKNLQKRSARKVGCEAETKKAFDDALTALDSSH